jgi:hypothetical protein
LFSTACPAVNQNFRGTLKSLITYFVFHILPFLHWVSNHPHPL